MSKQYLRWLNTEIERTNNELQGYYKSIKLSIEESISSSSNLVELIRTSQVKLKTLEQCKITYNAYNGITE